jgi:hypothetical protein
MPFWCFLHPLSLISPEKLKFAQKIPTVFPQPVEYYIILVTKVDWEPVGRYSTDAEAVQKIARLSCAESQHTTKEVADKSDLLFFISFVFNGL